ncbi:MAG: hypothetical protein WCR42_08220 [bacterium]
MKTENEIKSLFKSAGLEEPSDFFESNIMERIALERPLLKAAKPKPIISVKMIIGVAISLIVIFILSIAIPETNGESGRLSSALTAIENLFTKNYKDWAILPIIASSAFILLLIDNLFNKQRQKKFR